MWFTIGILTSTTFFFAYVVLRQRLCDDLRPPRREWFDPER